MRAKNKLPMYLSAFTLILATNAATAGEAKSARNPSSHSARVSRHKAKELVIVDGTLIYESIGDIFIFNTSGQLLARQPKSNGEKDRKKKVHDLKEILKKASEANQDVEIIVTQPGRYEHIWINAVEPNSAVATPQTDE